MNIVVRRQGQVGYETACAAMTGFTDHRDGNTVDEIWLLEHPPVFTLGMNATPGHVLAAGDIPVIQTDRGGQVTYHGPGQVVAYVMLDLQRRRLGVRALVDTLQDAVIGTLERYGIKGSCQPKAPGVYVDGAKIASLGLRVRRGCSYHGLALNVNMDLSPFSRINPCGIADLAVTQVSDHGGPDDRQVSSDLEQELLKALAR